VDYYTGVLKKYVDFSGRARRAEYWMFVLISTLISIGLSIVDSILGSGGILEGIYGLAVLLPGIAVAVRRLHDTNRSGWWLLIGLIPILGWIALLIFLIQDSDPGDNKYGANPKGVAGPTAGDGPAADQRLTDLESLRSRGLITDAEYQAKRQEILSGV
jgi:uncharacterized membrane protein YhaH (DUF805 family)